MNHLTERNIEVIDEPTAAMFRAMTGPQRRQVSIRMYDSARQRIENHLRRRNPDWSERDVTWETIRRLSHGAVEPDPKRR